MKKLCNICNKEFIFNSKRSSHLNDTCSYDCLRKSGIVRKKFLITFLKNKNVQFDENNILEMERLFSCFQSESTKKSINKKNKTIKQKYGDVHNFYSKSGKKARINFLKKELLNNNIINNDDLNTLTYEELKSKFNSFFYKKTNHVEKIKNGRLKKHGTIENVKISYKNATIKTVCLYYNIENEKWNTFKENEKNNLIKKYKKEIKFFNHDKIKWKKTHLKNLNLIKENDNIQDEKIHLMYSEYISDRFNTNSLYCLENGYKKSKKGWYFFKNKNGKLFYRSSWELIVFQKLDELLGKKIILDVFESKRIKFFYNKRFRYYYPDVSYLDLNGIENVLEIKPKKLINKEINICKFNAAREIYNNFLILSEDKIFSDDIENFLIKDVKCLKNI